jgi:hypothetical protein
VINAFVNTKRKKDREAVFCYLLEGFEQKGMCVELDRALYSLRDSLALWYDNFVTTLQALGLKLSKEEPCLCYDKQRRVLVIFYVDNINMLYYKRDAHRV